MVLVQIPELMRYIFGPLPIVVCIFHLWIKNVTFLIAMLFYDGILLTNYLFIFWLKNPSAFKDDFWNNFFNKWVICFGTVSQLIFLMMPGNQPLNFFLCSGMNPKIQYQTKVNYTMVFVQVGSIALHIVLSIKIQLFKRKVAKMEQLNDFTQNKQIFLFNIEKDTLVGFAVNFVNVALFALSGFFISRFNNLIPVKINIYPNYLIMYIWHLIYPLCICFNR